LETLTLTRKILRSAKGALTAEAVGRGFEHQSEDGIQTGQGWAYSDSAGNLYGTTYYGGTNGQQRYPTGCGTVFELIPLNGKLNEKVLYSFCPTSNCPLVGSLVVA
jgi:hypothetical protein